MERFLLSNRAFIAPDGSNHEEVISFAREVLDLVLAYAGSATSRAPLPAARLGHDAAVMSEQPVPDGELLDRLLNLLRGSMNPAHPGYVGHMDTLPALASILGEFASASVNNNMLSDEMSPAFSQLERNLTEHLARLFGLGNGAGGVLTSGGSLANLHALAVARNAAFGALEGGIWQLGRQPVILASQAAHTSLHKAAMLLGLGTSAVVPVAVDEGGRMSAQALQQCLAEVRHAGQVPFCVVATAGTTVTGAIDHLRDLGMLAHAEGLWFHVDAAYGGAVIVSEAHRPRLDGIDLADSITFNPQKWWYVAKTCAMVLFRDFGAMVAAFRVGAPYMRSGVQLNLGEVSVQGTRHAEILKLWLTMQHLGRQGLAQLVDEGYHLAERVAAEVRARPWLELASAGDTNIVCFRAAPPELEPEEHDALNALLQSVLLEDDEIFVSLPLRSNRRWLRVVLLNPYTGLEVVERLFARLDVTLRQALAERAAALGV